MKAARWELRVVWAGKDLYDEEGVPYGGVYRSPASSVSPTYFTMITNGRGDVLELLDANGNPFASYRYDAWGLPQASGTTTQATSLITSTLAGQIASRQVLRYASYAYDAESGLYYCSARYYDPATRQWTTADSAKADGEESAYQYCGGEPVNKVDPAGQRSYERTVRCSSWRGHFYVNLSWNWDGLNVSGVRMQAGRLYVARGEWAAPKLGDWSHWYYFASKYVFTHYGYRLASDGAFGSFGRWWVTAPKYAPMTGLDAGVMWCDVSIYHACVYWTSGSREAQLGKSLYENIYDWAAGQ